MENTFQLTTQYLMQAIKYGIRNVGTKPYSIVSAGDDMGSTLVVELDDKVFEVTIKELQP